MTGARKQEDPSAWGWPDREIKIEKGREVEGKRGEKEKRESGASRWIHTHMWHMYIIHT